jgi:hypothetical protein
MNAKSHLHLGVLVTTTILWFLTTMLAANGAEAALGLAGYWEGDITLPGSKLGVHVDLKQEAAGTWAGTIDIPAQGLRGFKLGSVKAEGSAVSFEMPGIPGAPAFAGKLDASGKTIAGDFSQSGQKLPFALTRKDRAAVEVPAKGMPGRGLAGSWLGLLKPSPTVELRLRLEITSGRDERIEGVMVSLDQGDARIPLAATMDKAGKVKLDLPKVGGTFEGSFNADGSELSCEWQQGGQTSPLTFKRLGKDGTATGP